MANSINWGKIYESTYWGSGVTDNTINWGKSYRNLAGDPAPFITEWRTETNGETITIPIQTNNTYTITTSEGHQFTTDVYNPTITFQTAGTHEVSISGDIQQIQFNNTGDKDKIYDIKQWGTDTTWTYFTNAFYGCSFLNITAADVPIMAITNFSRTFRGTDLTTFNRVNDWDVSNVINMTDLFRDSNFNEDISGWDVSNVTIFNQSFRSSAFNQDIGNWNVSSATIMKNLFFSTPFNQDIGNWDVSNVTTMQAMFQSNTEFDQDISGWDITNVTTFTNFLLGATLSTANYDDLLNGWYSTLKAIYVDPASPPSSPGS